MTKPTDTALEALLQAGRHLDARGWVPATSGNLSIRQENGQIAITRSGAHKGRLSLEDLLILESDGRPSHGGTPSAETGLHLQIYQRDPSIRAVLHPHSPGATLISRLFGEAIVLEDYELLKALEGVTTHEARVTLPIFDNDQDIQRLAATVDRWMNAHGQPQAYLIRQHGLYTWGSSVEVALRKLEALEFLFDIESRLYGRTPS